LTSLLSAGLASVGWNETELNHLRGPLFVVIAAAARFAEVMLPLVHHLVHKRRNDLAVGTAKKGRGIERDFVDDLGVSLPVAKSLAREEAPAAL
jgi:hypothetical protein